MTKNYLFSIARLRIENFDNSTSQIMGKKSVIFPSFEIIFKIRKSKNLRSKPKTGEGQFWVNNATIFKQLSKVMFLHSSIN